MATQIPPAVRGTFLEREILAEAGEHEQQLAIDLCDLCDLELSEPLARCRQRGAQLPGVEIARPGVADDTAIVG